MPDSTELTPWQRLVLAFWALFAVLFRADVARGVERVREEHRRLLGRPGGAGQAAPSRPTEPPWSAAPPREVAPPRAAAPPPAPTGAPAPAARPATPTVPPPTAGAPTQPAAAPVPAAKPTAGEAARPDARAALQVLSVLQREGRLVDFIEEDLAGFPDATIGAAARTVHAGCKRAIEELFRLEPVYRETEGAQVTVAPGFDPSAIRLTGNVVGKPPFRGALRHHGWRAREVRLPSVDGTDPNILAPAEIEL